MEALGPATRGRLFDRELTMLVEMRGVLTDPQWNRMRNELDRLQQLLPGASQGLDTICDGILARAPFVLRDKGRKTALAVPAPEPSAVQ